MDENITREQFIRLLSGAPEDKDCDLLLQEALEQRWIEPQDLTDSSATLKRIDAARIIHLYIREVRKTADLPDISGAEILKDLYDCRVCVNHIAQVFLRGYMDAVSIPSGKESTLIFDSQSPVKKSDMLAIISNFRV